MIQVYIGKGKGKTTAALGLAARAAGSGLKVYIAQFTRGLTLFFLGNLTLTSLYSSCKMRIASVF